MQYYIDCLKSTQHCLRNHTSLVVLVIHFLHLAFADCRRDALEIHPANTTGTFWIMSIQLCCLKWRVTACKFVAFRKVLILVDALYYIVTLSDQCGCLTWQHGTKTKLFRSHILIHPALRIHKLEMIWVLCKTCSNDFGVLIHLNNNVNLPEHTRTKVF